MPSIGFRAMPIMYALRGGIVRFDCPQRAHCRVANCLRENDHAAQFAPCIASRWEQSNPDNSPAQGILTDLRVRFDDVLAQLESVAGWKTARVQRPVQILGSLDGIETGVRQLIRDEPLETMVLDYRGERLTVPTEGEILRIKGVLILKRNATRDYLDFVALADYMGDDRVAQALLPFDKLYPQDNGESALQQLHVQLANALPYDLEEMALSEYKNLAPRWHDWNAVKAICAHVATAVFDRICDLENARPDDGYRMK